MSFQYIYPNYSERKIINYVPQQVQTPVFSYNMANPYQTSIYYNNAVYPYNNPLYTPKINGNYNSLGQLQLSNGDIAHLFSLKSGQKVAILPKKDTSTIVKTFLNGGSMNEVDSIRGISHCIEHFLFKGSSKFKDGDVFKLSASMGGRTNASTDYAKTDYYILAPYMDENNLAKTIEIQADMISSPRFDLEAIEAEKGPVCSEISMINDDISTVAMDKAIRNLFQINSNSKNLVAGSINTVKSLKREDIVNHHQTYYTPDNLFTVVVGDVDVDKTMDLISRHFNIKSKSKELKQRTETLTPINTSVREDIKSNKTKFSQIYTTFAGPKPENYRDFLMCDILNLYLTTFSTSKLNNDLKKMNLECATGFQKVGLRKDDA